MDKTAIIYARVSTARQAEEELPVASQVEECERKAGELGARVDRVFRDEGISGTLEDRPGFQDAIAYAQAYQPDYLVTWSTSRFARNKVDAGLYKQKLAKAGVELIYVSLNIDRDSDGGWITEGILELFDEFYSRQISADTKRSQIQAAQQGFYLGGRVPFGFQAVPDAEQPKRKRLQPDPTEAALVRRIFEMRAEGWGAKSIAIRLNEAGHTRRGKRWSRSVIHELLRSETVIGRRVFGKRDRNKVARPRKDWIVVDSHEPVIDRELWDRVQAMMDDETPKPESGSSRSTHLFTGLLRCGRCGGSLQAESAKGRSKRYWYYNCRNATVNKSCPPRRFNAREMDAWLVDLVGRRIFTRENLEGLIREMEEACSNREADRRQRRHEIATRLQAVEEKKNRIFEVMETYGADTPNLGDLTQRLRQHNAEAEELQQELARVDAEQAPEISISDQEIDELATFLTTAIKETDNPRKVRAFLSSFIEYVEVGEKEVRIEYDPQKIVNRPEGGAVHSVPGWLGDQDSNLG